MARGKAPVMTATAARTFGRFSVGCGVLVIEAEPGVMLAIACRCGALAPVLDNGEGGHGHAVPLTLLLATGNMPPPHLEYYLGFSGHQSATKTELTRQLRALGSISYVECTEPVCHAAWERSKERYERRKEGHDDATLHDPL